MHTSISPLLYNLSTVPYNCFTFPALPYLPFLEVLTSSRTIPSNPLSPLSLSTTSPLPVGSLIFFVHQKPSNPLTLCRSATSLITPSPVLAPPLLLPPLSLSIPRAGSSLLQHHRSPWRRQVTAASTPRDRRRPGTRMR